MRNEDCLVFYRYDKNPDGSVTPRKIFVTPAVVLNTILDKLHIKLENLMGYPEPDEIANSPEKVIMRKTYNAEEKIGG